MSRPSRTSVKVYGCNHVAIEVGDIKKAIAFYKDVFNLEQLDQPLTEDGVIIGHDDADRIRVRRSLWGGLKIIGMHGWQLGKRSRFWRRGRVPIPR